MVPVLLLGELGKTYGRRFTLDVKSPAEAIRALVANFPDIQKHMADRYYRVVVGKEDTGEDELHNPIGRQTIKIVPVVVGAGSAFKIILGAVLIASTFFIPGLNVVVAQMVFSMGASLILGGVAQMLAPSPQSGSPNEQPENTPSYLFNGPVNTTAQGQPVAVGYGRLRIGSAVISASLVAEQIAV